MLLITFKAVHGLAPVSSLAPVNLFPLENLLEDITCVPTPGLRLKYNLCKSFATLGDRSFHVVAPKLWNDLPSDIRSMTSVQSFKKAIKTFLF